MSNHESRRCKEFFALPPTEVPVNARHGTTGPPVEEHVRRNPADIAYSLSESRNAEIFLQLLGKTGL